jgi:hypothetical protein
MATSNTDLSLTAQSWADIVIKRWEEKVVRLKVYKTGALLKSFEAHVSTQANGNPAFIEFAFNYYGKFVDMGVGNGITKDMAGNGPRRVKQWYSKTFFSQVKRLGEIISEKYAYKAQLSIITNITTDGTK